MSRRIFVVVMALLALCGALPVASQTAVATPATPEGRTGDDVHDDDDDDHESYPFKAPSLSIKPNYCRSGQIDGIVEGATAGTYVTVRLVFQLANNASKTVVIRKRADSDGDVKFKLRLPSGAHSAVITATGTGAQSGQDFSLATTLDLSGCKQNSGAHCSKSNVWSRTLCTSRAKLRS